jgi:hypothetical protein
MSLWGLRSSELTNTKGVLEYEMEQVAIELQHINVKLFVKDPEQVDLEAVVPVFHTWIQGQIFDELLLDVADYSHVPDGPGVVLIGHEADYALDNTDGRLGVRYNRKAPWPGSNRERLAQATRSALNAFQRLEQDFNLRFNNREIEIVVNDRLLAPNNDETRNAVEPELKAFLDQLFGGTEYSLRYPIEGRRLFGARVELAREVSVEELLGNVGIAAA